MSSNNTRPEVIQVHPSTVQSFQVGFIALAVVLGITIVVLSDQVGCAFRDLTPKPPILKT